MSGVVGGRGRLALKGRASDAAGIAGEQQKLHREVRFHAGTECAFRDTFQHGNFGPRPTSRTESSSA